MATGCTWLHQLLVDRLTFASFRLYATAVSAGVGGVFGCTFGWWLMAGTWSGSVRLVLWLACTLALIVGFGLAAFRGARSLRGEAPTGLTSITL
jgi:hypothetical protein